MEEDTKPGYYRLEPLSQNKMANLGIPHNITSTFPNQNTY
jgi:hypothetical protein